MQRFLKLHRHLCVYDERRARYRSRDISPDIPMWLKNGVSSHSYIGHCAKAAKKKRLKLTKTHKDGQRHAKICVSLHVFACLCVSLRVVVSLCVSLCDFACLCLVWVSL